MYFNVDLYLSFSHLKIFTVLVFVVFVVASVECISRPMKLNEIIKTENEFVFVCSCVCSFCASLHRYVIIKLSKQWHNHILYQETKWDRLLTINCKFQWHYNSSTIIAVESFDTDYDYMLSFVVFSLFFEQIIRYNTICVPKNRIIAYRIGSGKPFNEF